jgi:mannose-1-phosphate guanylyltransferase/mannose-6-phosphate isomerase
MMANAGIAQAQTRGSVYCVILAGGDGERLWPLSRQHKPKQLLSLYGNKTLLEQAVDRAQLVASSPDTIWVVTSAQHEEGVRQCVGDTVATIVVEPVARNTAAAIITTCEEIYRCDPLAQVLFIPADSFIPLSEYGAFSDGIHKALSFIDTTQAIVIFGVQPRHAATGYGYIEYDETCEDNGVFKVQTFHEKPARAVAEQYIKNPTMLWNICMFCAPVGVFLSQAELHCPAIVSGVRAAFYDRQKYSLIPSEPIDCAVIEKSDCVWAVPLDITWYDVGNVGVFLSLREAGTQESNNVMYLNSNNNLVDVPDKLVALIGVDDLCIVDTGDTLLISRRDNVESVKELVRQLKQEGRNNYL